MKNVSIKIICSQNDMSQMLVYSDVSFTDVDEWYLNALNKGFKLFFFLSLVCGNNRKTSKIEVRLLQPTMSSTKMVNGAFLAGI